MLLECCGSDVVLNGEEMCQIVAPCTHNGHCPMNVYGPFISTTDSEKEKDHEEAPSPTHAPHVSIPAKAESDNTPETTKQVDDEETDVDDDDSHDHSDDQVDDEEEDLEFEEYFEADEDEDDDAIPPGYIEIPFEYQDNVEAYLKKLNESKPQNEPPPPVVKGYCSFVHTFSGRKAEKFSYLVVQKRIKMEEEEGKQQAEHVSREVKEDSEYFHFLENGKNISEWLGQLVDEQQQDLNKDRDESKQKRLRVEHKIADLARKFEQREVAQGSRVNDSDGLGLVRAAPSSFGRVIRAPKKPKGHVLIDTCTNKGIVRQTIPKSLSKRAPGIYQAARKARWGGFWPNPATLKNETN